MRFSAVSEEVLYTTEPITSVSRSDIALLKSMAMKNTRKRIRLCAHPDTDDPLHEMIIVHARGAYIRPHKHPGKSESFHIIEGRLKVVIFEEDGGIRDVLRMGKSGDQILYYRLSESLFHTVIPLSRTAVFHETTNGPFRRGNAVFAPWSPAEEDERARAAYMRSILSRINDC